MNDFLRGERYVPKPQAGTLAVMRRFGPFNHPLSNRQNCNHSNFLKLPAILTSKERFSSEKVQYSLCARRLSSVGAAAAAAKVFTRDFYVIFLCVPRKTQFSCGL